MKLTRPELDEIKRTLVVQPDSVFEKLIIHAEETVDGNPAQPTDLEMRSIVAQVNEARHQSLRLQLGATFLSQLLHGESWANENRVNESVRLADDLLAELERTR